MAKRVVKTYGKRGVRRLDLSDEWKCVKESPVYTRVLPSPLITSHKWSSVAPQPIMDHSSPATPPTSSSTPNNMASAGTMETSSGSDESAQSSSTGWSIVTSPPSTVDSSPSTPYMGCRTTTSPPSTVDSSPSPPYMGCRTTTSPPSTSLLADKATVRQSDPVSTSHTCTQSTMSPVLFEESSSDPSPPPHSARTTVNPSSVGGTLCIKDDFVLYLSRLSLKDSNHEGSLSCHSLKTPPPSASAKEGKENAIPQEAAPHDSLHSNCHTPAECVPACSFSVEAARPPTINGSFFLVENEVQFSQALSPSRSSTPCASTQRSTTSTLSLHHSSCFLTFLSPLHPSTLSSRQKVLSLCGQRDVPPFSDYLTQGLCEVMKLGEGQYGEVFSLERAGMKVAIKVVPVDGPLPYNGDQQKSLDEVLQEMVISKELSDLSGSSGDGQTSGFVRVHRLAYCTGRYPPPLVTAWEEWAAGPDHECENDHPGVFGEEQCYVIFETDNAGVDLEHAKVNKTSEAVSVFYQICGALAVAEEALHFEHRDLHWGNVLVSPTSEANVMVTLGGTTHRIPSEGFRATIIDYTLSRMEQAGCVSYNNLTAVEWLFGGTGDHQFEVYRLMRDETRGDWRTYHPRTNVLWLDYLAKKLLTKLKRPGAQIRSLAQSILQCRSAREVFCHRT